MINDIFKVELYKVKLNNIDNSKIINYINENISKNFSKDDKGVDKNDSIVLKNKIFEVLNREIMYHLNILFYKTVKPQYKLILSQGWFNKGSDDLIADPHKHANSLYSAVYYPLSTDGLIKFLNPANSLNYKLHNKHLKYYDSYNCENWSESVRTGELLIFKSGMFHWALPTKNERYSIAYNTEVVDA
jgi:hypothetical protein